MPRTCWAGVYCPQGMSTVPDNATNACPLGNYCPPATPVPLTCDPGSYANVTGAAACGAPAA